MEKKERWTLAAVLPLIVLVMFLVWGIKPRTDDIRTAVSADGIWVLEDTELMQTAVRLTGDVEYVPNALLTPQEFEGRTDIRIGQPGDNGARCKILSASGIAGCRR